jgi:hypothetical protein
LLSYTCALILCVTDFSRHREGMVPTRRTLELIVITVLALQPAMAMAKLWSIRTLATAPTGSVVHGVAEIANVVL